MDLPPGFRFHPTDEELITHYLSPKLVDNNFSARAIGDVDLNKCEPWDLPRLAKMGEKEWYFFCVRDRKYPTGLRTNRATEAGYWKATGKDKEIFRGKALVGMKKTLVFYKGRAPKGQKSNWVMHEYRLEGKTSLQNIPSTSKSDWVISRVFNKNAAGKKIPYPGLIRSDSIGIKFHPCNELPPLTESPPYRTTIPSHSKPNESHVTCFSNPMDVSINQTSHNNPHETSFNTFIINNNNNTPINSLHSNPISSHFSSRIGSWNPTHLPQANYFMSDQHILQAFIKNNGTELKQSMKTEGVNYSVSQDTCLSSEINAEISSVVSNYEMGLRPFDDPSTSGGPVDLDVLWNY